MLFIVHFFQGRHSFRSGGTVYKGRWVIIHVFHVYLEVSQVNSPRCEGETQNLLAEFADC